MKTIVLTPLLLLAACEPGGDAPFATASNAQIGRSFASAGLDAYAAVDFASRLAGTTRSGCLTVVTTGPHTVVTGNGACDVFESDERWDGSLTIDSSSDRMSLVFDDFHWAMTLFGIPNDLAYDGTVTATQVDGVTTAMDTDLAVAFNGVRARGTGHVALPRPALLDVDDLTIEVDGLGTASVSGSWALDDADTVVTLHGADDAVIDLADAHDGCLDYTIDDRLRGTLCGFAVEPPLTDQ